MQPIAAGPVKDSSSNSHPYTTQLSKFDSAGQASRTYTAVHACMKERENETSRWLSMAAWLKLSVVICKFSGRESIGWVLGGRDAAGHA